MHTRVFLFSLFITFILSLVVLFSTSGNYVIAQEAIISPSATSTPLAHLTFRTCLIPNTNTFRLYFRADYHPGEYRIVAQNTGEILNLGYLSVGQEGGGLGPDNTLYVIHEDIWKKQWFNGIDWQRSGGMPVTSVQQHIDEGAICEIGDQHTPYVTGYIPTPTNTPNPGPITLRVEDDNIPTPTPISPTTTPSVSSSATLAPTVDNNQTNASNTLALANNTKQVLGSSTLGETGSFMDYLTTLLLVLGIAALTEGSRRFS